MLINLYRFKKISPTLSIIFNNLIQFFWYFKKNSFYINNKKIIKFQKSSNLSIQYIFFINNKNNLFYKNIKIFNNNCIFIKKNYFIFINFYLLKNFNFFYLNYSFFLFNYFSFFFKFFLKKNKIKNINLKLI